MAIHFMNSGTARERLGWAKALLLVAIGIAFVLVSSVASAQPAALPEGNTGIASHFPNDVGIKADSQVIFVDDFEGYGATPKLTSKWNASVNGDATVTPAGAFAGANGLQLQIPVSNVEVGAGVAAKISPERDVMFMRYYSKYDPSFDIYDSSHNGAGMSSHYYVWNGSWYAATPGVPADGFNKYLVQFEAWRSNPNDPNLGYFLNLLGLSSLKTLPNPGVLNLYIYWPQQRSNYGDHFYFNGIITPYDSKIGNGNTFTNFTPRPSIVPSLGKWYCYEIMVKANTVSSSGTVTSDGRIALWLDGKLVADWPNLVLRKTASLTMDWVNLSLHAWNVPVATQKYYDNVVVATSYIGPVANAATAPSSPTQLQVR